MNADFELKGGALEEGAVVKPTKLAKRLVNTISGHTFDMKGTHRL